MKRIMTAAAVCLALLAAAGAVVGAAVAQGTPDDYERAEGLRARFDGLAYDIADEPSFTPDSRTLVYRKLLKGGAYEFVAMDVATLAKAPAFNPALLAEALSKASMRQMTGTRLPFQRFEMANDRTSIELTAVGARWRCELFGYTCEKLVEPPAKAPPVGMGDPGPIGMGPPADKAQLASLVSPDGKTEALIRDYNLFVRAAGAQEMRQLSFDGGLNAVYVLAADAWSPDGKMLALNRVRPGEERYVSYVESSPAGQKQPKLTELYYQKPGDVLADRQPVLFDLESGKATVVDRTLFPNAYWQSEPVWWEDGRGFYIFYNQRGHQAYRVIEVNRQGVPRSIIHEQAKTFFEYSSKRVFEATKNGAEIVWMSERDGWAHLYLYDGLKGQVKNQITHGAWAVRGVVDVDRIRRTVTFSANGMRPGEDPYFVHYYRISFDGTGLVALTDAPATHTLTFAPDKQTYVDIYSRVDMAPVALLRRSSDASVIATLETGNIDGLMAAGWRAPEPFVAKGRDGVTDIYGLIVKPSTFDPAKRYPVIENIYAGPQGAFTPKSFAVFRQMNALAELGFVVVQMDGMGTNYRSKAFHDVAWKNLQDAGFPDRILWHKAAAAKFPWYNIDRVGIYGGSAGGQNAMGALLFHPDFYKVAVAFAGSHDNRMDKIWWNEQYMGWPVGPEYAAASNVDNAWRLRGDLMLVVGELDTNVDPSSTYQVVDALIKANKDFEFLFVPGAGHSEGGAYGERKRWDFFVEKILGVKPPDRNAPRPAPASAQIPQPASSVQQ